MSRLRTVFRVHVAALNLAVLTCFSGCLPVDGERPECFASEGCADGRACVAGACVEPEADGLAAVRVEVGRCFGAACRGGTGVACLVVKTESNSAYALLPAAAPDVTGSESVVLDRGLPPGPVTAALFWLSRADACVPVLDPANCDAALGCMVAVSAEAEVPAEGPWILNFDDAAGRCTAVAAEPAAEVCDGIDQDCDGLADEGLPGVGDPCNAGTGDCTAVGNTVCDASGAVVCEGPVGTPTAELADGRDNDCDGQVDESVPDVGCVPQETRPCGVDLGVCRQGLRTCGPDGAFGPCLDEGGSAVTAPGDAVELCNGLDDDCDGRAEEGLATPEGIAVGEACTLGVGSCAVVGRATCEVGAAPACTGGEPQVPQAETCNDTDDDCDGRVDEDFEPGTPCVAGLGRCAVSGRMRCLEDGTAECAVDAAEPPGETDAGVDDAGAYDAGADDGGAGDEVLGPVAELCNGEDDDCDGSTDEDFAALGMACSLGAGACATAGFVACAPDGSAGCDAVVPAAVDEICNGLDDDCDDSVDEAFDLTSDAANCGVCSRTCVLAEAEAACVESACRVASCMGTAVDADGQPDNGCECQPDAEDLPDALNLDTDCDGVDGTPATAILVDPLGDDAGDGTASAPLRSIVVALSRLDGQRTALYLTTGVHRVDATLDLPAGVGLHGGYRIEPGTFRLTRVPAEVALTVLRGPPTVLRVGAIAAPSVVDRVRIESADAAAGGSSIAVVVLDAGNNFSLQDVEIAAGSGGTGRAGSAGEPGQNSAQKGRSAQAGDDEICPGCGGPGGRNAVCEGGDAGDGGRSAEGLATAGAAGALAGQPGQAGLVGGPGEAGAAGTSGAAGSLGSSGGAWDSGWVPRRGGAGLPGAVGGGGGGGGAGLPSAAAPFDLRGGGGGGGGAGACGGQPGLGGYGGGLSVALLVRGAVVTLIGGQLSTASGGDGGSGGAAGPGASGGVQGLGASASVACAECTAGGNGGRGGDGGCGGPGGGGGGGGSAAVLRFGAGGTRLLDLEGAAPGFAPGIGGVAGPGGVGLAACTDAGRPGAAGLSAVALCCAGDGPDGGCDDLAPCAPEAN